MTLTVQNLRDYVRDSLDVDSTELPDSLLDVWRDEGISHIQRQFEPWSFYEATWTTSTATGSVALSSIGSASSQPESIEDVLYVDSDDRKWKLDYMPFRNAEVRYGWSADTTSAWPEKWSLHGSTIYVWPTTTSTLDLFVLGRRKPIVASAAADTPDVPVEFQPLVAEWILARAYERDDDEIMSSQKFNRFDQQVDMLRRRYTRAPASGIQVVGGTCEYVSDLSQRLRFDWE